MQVTELKKLMVENKTDKLSFTGKCHDCGAECVVKIDTDKAKRLVIHGGAVYSVNIDGDDTKFLKCNKCFATDPTLRHYQPNAVYSRVTGYLRPVDSWNGAKQSEHKKRVVYKVPDLTTPKENMDND